MKIFAFLVMFLVGQAAHAAFIPATEGGTTVLPEIYDELVWITGSASLDGKTSVSWTLSDADGALDSVGDLLTVNIGGSDFGSDWTFYEVTVTTIDGTFDGSGFKVITDSFFESFELDFSLYEDFTFTLNALDRFFGSVNGPAFGTLDAVYLLTDDGNGGGPTASVPTPATLPLMLGTLLPLVWSRRKAANS